ncbi:uncharacterized protein LOC122507288 [Leptopilina heterotoma]|uniref:uncharacterized protein LOC122507288 n=1 Tax=Leptopilina heterotoma TaxID=63436 RepID=UPI001CA8C146|nr:uncharacterized protein LOC122507288 [Leptopilina heterotoma]
MKLKIIMLCLLPCVLSFDNKLDSPSKRFLASLSASDREDYLIFALAKGYSTFNSNNRNKTVRNLISRSLKNYPETINKFEELQTPENFENNFYAYAKKDYSLSQQNVKTLIDSRRICFNRKRCISIDDIGNMCCPF